MGGCGSMGIPWGTMRSRYQLAIRDAEVAEPDEVAHDLTAITLGEPGLLWKGTGKDRRVLVVTWTDSRRFDRKVGRAVALREEQWVTVAPQVQRFCRPIDTTRHELELRLEQLLGLPPGRGSRRFVELWVRPADLFRPCPDPEITDHECRLEGAPGAIPGVDDAHRRWLEAWKRKAYRRGGFPLTRLGYTYDWGNPYSEQGLSEFVVRPRATVLVADVEPTREYCRRPAAKRPASSVGARGGARTADAPPPPLPRTPRPSPAP